MPSKNSLVIAVFVLVALAGIANAQEAIIATDITAVDAAVSSAAGTKAGVPVFITDNGEITDEIKNALSEASIKTVILVGGPVVIPESVETELEELGYEVIRLWGIERTGTAVQVLRHFWPEGGCAVLVDDTKNSDADGLREILAANHAARKGCALIPVPKGTVPAEVLSLLEELDIDDVRYVGANPAAIRAKLTLSEEIGEDEVDDILEEEADAATRLVIVAAPSWSHMLGVAAHPNDDSVVKILTDVSQVPRLVTFIQDKGITDVRVVGMPALAGKIASALADEGIEVSRISGEKASEVAKKVWEKNKERWVEKREKVRQKLVSLRRKIKAKLLERLNDTEEFFNEEEVELETDGVPELREKLTELKNRLADVRGALAKGDIETARKTLSKIRNSYMQLKHRLREKIKFDIETELEEEEGTTNVIKRKIEAKISSIDKKLSALSQRCEVVDSLVERAKSLKELADEAKEAGNERIAAMRLSQARKALSLASNAAALCKAGKTPEKVSEVLKKRVKIVEKVEGVLTRVQKRLRAVGEIEKISETAKETAERNIVEITAAGFEPNTLRIKAGETVVFVNKDTNAHWPASAVHPTHTVYPGSSISKCGTDEADNIFDACTKLQNGEEYSFTFNEKGTWKYHDHLNPRFTGTIVVE